MHHQSAVRAIAYLAERRRSSTTPVLRPNPPPPPPRLHPNLPLPMSTINETERRRPSHSSTPVLRPKPPPPPVAKAAVLTFVDTGSAAKAALHDPPSLSKSAVAVGIMCPHSTHKYCRVCIQVHTRGRWLERDREKSKEKAPATSPRSHCTTRRACPSRPSRCSLPRTSRPHPRARHSPRGGCLRPCAPQARGGAPIPGQRRQGCAAPRTAPL